MNSLLYVSKEKTGYPVAGHTTHVTYPAKYPVSGFPSAKLVVGASYSM